MMPISNPSRRLLLKSIGLLPAFAYGFGTFSRHAVAEELNCAVAPTMTEGPYWLDKKLHRADIRTETNRSSVLEGLPLNLTIQVYRAEANSCGGTPVENVQIDIWHADAIGEYSGVSGMGQSDTRSESFLRGYQISDNNGTVSFTTIYPGWYRGRSIHIHVRARTYDADGNTTYDFTTQFFFAESLNDTVHESEPYSNRGTRDTLNSNDMHYLGVDSPLLVSAENNDNGSITGNIAIGLANLPSEITPLSNFSASLTSAGDATNLSLSSTLNISAADVGLVGSLYALAEVNGVWYVRDGNNWVAYTAAMANAFPALYSGTLKSQHTVNLMSGINVQMLGMKIYVGYGIDTLDMLGKQQYQVIYTHTANATI